MTDLLQAPSRTYAPDGPPAAVTSLPVRGADPAALAPAVGTAVRGWVRRHAVSLPIVACLLALCGWLVGTGIAHFPAFGDDEGTYVAEAWAFLHHGQLSHYTYWYDHPPLGWIQLAALTWILGPLVHGVSALATARQVMLAPALATAGLLYVLSRRLRVARPFAAITVLLLIGSPLGLASLRQVYLENLALPWVIAAFALAASPSRRLWAYAASGVCFAVAVLSKETMLLFLPGLLLVLVDHVDRRTRVFCLTGFGAAFVLVGVGYPLYALLKGELLPGAGHVSLEQAVTWQLFTRRATGSVFAAHSAAHRLLDSWLAVDPWLLGAGVAAILPALLIRRVRGVALALVVAILVALRGGYLPEPFVIGLLPFCALLPPAVLDAVAGRAGPSTRPPLRNPETGGYRRFCSRGLLARRAVRSTLAGLAVAVFAVLVVPSWWRADAYAMRADQTKAERSAERWIEVHVPHRARLLIDDTMYVDLVRAGFAPRYGVVWFYKLGFTNNLDPAIVRHLPHGWREFDYVVSTPVIRSALGQDPGGYREVTQALAHSRTVASFGTGKNVIQVRRLVGTGIGSGHLPQVPHRSSPQGTSRRRAG